MRFSPQVTGNTHAIFTHSLISNKSYCSSPKQEFIELALLDHDGRPEKLDGYHIVVIRGMEENRGVGEDRRGPTIEV